MFEIDEQAANTDAKLETSSNDTQSTPLGKG